MPRVLIAGFCSLPGRNRASIQLRHIAGGLKRSHLVDLLVLRRGDQAYVERFAGGRILRVPMPDEDFESRVGAYRRALSRQLEGADYDIVHFRDGWSGIPVLEAQPRFGFATVFDVGRSPMAEPLLLDRDQIEQVRKDDRSCLESADLILAPHMQAGRYLGDRFGEEKVHVVPPGVDVDAFDWEEEPDTEQPEVLYLGTLAPGRGVRVLLRAWYDVARHSSAKLVLAGRASTDFADTLAAAVRDLGISDSVEYLGEVDHDAVPGLIARATICVAPGAVELAPEPVGLYPTKILEYLACKRPVVAAARSTVTMLLQNDEHGLLFDPGQPGHLAQQITRLLGDRLLRGRLAAAGYELVRRTHTASKTRRELRRAYGWLAAQPEWRERLARQIEADEGTAGESAGSAEWAGDSAPSVPEAAAGFLDDDTVTRDFGEATEVTRVDKEPAARDPGELGDEDHVFEHDSSDDWAIAVDSSDTDSAFFDDARTGVNKAAPERTEETPPVETRFVAGELEVPSPVDSRPDTDETNALSDDRFVAVTPLLGSGERETAAPSGQDEDGKTTVSPPPEPASPRPRGKRRGSTAIDRKR